MRTTTRLRLDLWARCGRKAYVAACCSSIAVAACGGGTPPNDATAAAAPPVASDAPPAPSAPAAPEATSSSASVPAPAPSAPEPAPAEPAPQRTLSDRLFAPTVAYMLNYSASPAKEKATQACSSKSADDPGALAACVEKERSKLVSDVLVFGKKDKNLSWTVYKRTGNQLLEIGSAQIDVSGDSPEKIDIKIKSEKGNRQLFAGKKQLTILSDSDSSIAVDDPQLGKLVYDARIGLMQTSE